MNAKKTSRRQFLRNAGTAAGAAAIFTIVPRHVLGGRGQTPPSEGIAHAVVGTGGRGLGAHVTVNREGEPPVTLAVCDVDSGHLARALKKAGGPCKGYSDFRRVLDRKDIDTVHIATPPHWHATIAVAAADAGFDILCEKPLTRTIAEGQALADAIRRNGRVLQVGTFGRFGNYQKQLRKLVASGLLGTPLTVRVWKNLGYNWKVKMWSGKENLEPQPIPPELDYNMWLGPAPYKPYHRHRTHGSFRGYWDYDNGGLGDMGQHFLDPVQYFLGKDDTMPVEIEAVAPWPQHPDAVGMWGTVTLKYADGTAIILSSGEWGEPEPTELPFLEGPKGKVLNKTKTDPPGLFDTVKTMPDPPAMIDFETAVRTRLQPGGNADVAHRSNSILLLSGIAIRMGRKLRFDPERQSFVGDEEANRLVHVPLRAPWHV